MNFAQLARSILILSAIVWPCWIAFRIVVGYRNRKQGIGPIWSREFLLAAFVIDLVIIAAMTIAPTAMSLNTDAGFNIIPLRTLVGEVTDVQSGPPGSLIFLIENWVGNIMLLFPLGIFLPLLSTRFRSLRNVFLASLAVTSFIEIVQLLSQFAGSYRVADIDDVILNTLGACLGFWVFRFGQKLFRRRGLTELSRFALVAVLLVSTLIASGCFSLFCKEDLIKEVDSPGGKHIATMFVTDCGATTNWATRVEVRWKSSSRDEDQDIIFSADGKPDVQIEWQDDTALVITCNTCSEDKVFRRVTKLGKINIRFTN